MRSIVGEIVSAANEVTIMDMEASIEHLSRGTVKYVDALLIVVEPYYRSLETAGRILPLAKDLGIKRVYGIGNKLRGEQDDQAVEFYSRSHDLKLIAKIPFDDSVTEADRTGRAVIDYDVTSAIVEELNQVANFLEREVASPISFAGGH